MGEEYQLKKLYEQMLKGSVSQSKLNKPKSLSEAYDKKLISERTVFFAKDDNKYTTIGVVDDKDEANEIKNNIKSFSIIATTTQMLEGAGWTANNPILSSRKLGSLLLQKDIDILDLTKIASKKEEFTNLEDYIFGKKTKGNEEKTKGKFDVIKAIVDGIQKVLGESQKTPLENFTNLVKSLITQTGRIEGTDVGPGEMAITLLTNAKKPSTKGDLEFSGKIVEAKASSYGKEESLSGAALGYAKYASGGALQAAIDEMLRRKEVSPNRALYKIKKFYDETVESVQTNTSLIPLTSQFFETLSKLTSLIATQNSELFKKQFNNLFGMNFDLNQNSNAKVLEAIKVLLKNNYLDQKAISQETLQNIKNDTFLAIKQLLYSGNGLFGKAKQAFKALSRLTTKAEETKDLQKQKPSLTVAFGDFFFSDLGFDNKQLASVLLEARPYREHDESLLQNLEKVLQEGYLKRLQRQDASALKGLLFALHLSEYAREEGFQCLMLFNYTTGNALAIPTQGGFIGLLNFFETHKQDISFGVDFVGRQGAHKLALR